MKRIAVLGSTGSIGTQTLDVARWRGYEIVGLAARRSVEELAAQCREFRPAIVACAADAAERLEALVPRGTRIVPGPEGAEEVAAVEADAVVAAIPGMAGLAPTLAAVRAGRRVALANKETMVVAGPLVRAEAAASGARIVPVDSEHSALYQCLLGEPTARVRSLVLTASGGPFRDGPADLSAVTPAQALQHPTWSMGPKVTVDSATLFNKGLEVLEAHVLFDWPLDRIEVVVHPQSLVHGLVRFEDGSIKAHIGPHDMRLPIQYAIEAPDRPPVPLEPMPLAGTWTFQSPDRERFPCLDLAYRAGRMGGTAPAALNAADEVAVEAFLAGELSFPGIPATLTTVLADLDAAEASWDAIREADVWARARAQELVREGSWAPT